MTAPIQNQSTFEHPATTPLRFGAQITMYAATGLKRVWDEDPNGAHHALTLIEGLADHASRLPPEDLREVIQGVFAAVHVTQRLAQDNVPATFAAYGPAEHPSAPRRALALPDTSDTPENAYLAGYLIASLAGIALKNAWLGDQEAADNTISHIERLSSRCNLLAPEDLRDVIDGLFDGIRTTHRLAARNLPVADLHTT